MEGHAVGSVRGEPEHEEPSGGGGEGVEEGTGGREPVERSVVKGDGVEKTKETPLKPFKPQFDLKVGRAHSFSLRDLGLITDVPSVQDAMEMIPPYSPSANSVSRQVTYCSHQTTVSASLSLCSNLQPSSQRTLV